MPDRKNLDSLIVPYGGNQGAGGFNPPSAPAPVPPAGLDPKAYLDGVLSNALAPATSYATSTLGGIVDFLSRPNYASAKFFDSTINESKSLYDSFSDAFDELIHAKQKLTFSDVLRKGNPQRAQEHPIENAVVGFLGDVLLDPTTYLGVGLVKDGIEIGGKALTKFGRKALVEGIEEGSKATRFFEKGGIDVIDVLDKEARHSARTGATEFSKAGKEILQDAGYFDAVENKVKQIQRQFGGKVDDDIIFAQAKKEVYNELKLQKAKGITDTGYDAFAVRSTIEDRIASIATAAPELKLLEKEGLHLTIGVPFGNRYEIPGSQKTLKFLGLDYLQGKIRQLGALIGSTDAGGTIGRTFNKKFDPNKTVPEEFWDSLNTLENSFDSNVSVVARDVKRLAKDIPEDRLNFIGQLGSDIRDASKLEEDKLGRTLTSEEAITIKRKMIDNAKLNPTEHAFLANMYQGFSKMQELEMQANLLRSSVTNYFPRGYELLKDPEELSALLKQGRSLNTFLPSSQQTKYKTLADAVADGYVPELNAAVLYAQRLVKSREKLNVADFNGTVRQLFDLGEGTHALTNKELVKLPEVVRSSIRMLGDAVYPTVSESANWLKAVDFGNRVFKTAAYAVKPSSAPRQVVSNALQASMVQGAKSFKMFDPRAAIDAAVSVFGAGKETSNVPDFIMRFFTKNAPSPPDAIVASRLALDNVVGYERLNNATKGAYITNVIGEKYPLEELTRWMQENGVIKGFDQSGEGVKNKVERLLRNNTDTLPSVAGKLAQYWKWPQLTEDYSRAMVFLNGIRMGYSPKQALGVVNKTLFDYSRGLSYLEKNVLRRVIPFYSYQRFAIPFVLKETVKHPGEAVTGQKALKLLEKLYSSDTLTPAEQQTFGESFIVDQPHLFKGFDKDGKAEFNIFNNLTPLDALSLLVFDKEGNVDYKRTVEKSVLAQFTPFLKVPIELIADKNFFTGQTLDKAGRLGDINQSTISAVIPDHLKELMSWEERVSKNGKRSVYVNPYMTYLSTSFVPALRTIVNMQDQSKSALDRSFQLFSGISAQKIDLKEQAQFNYLNGNKELDELKRKIRTAQVKGSQTEYDKARADYEKFVMSLRQIRATENIDQIRGEGLK